jgi:hypothetical protein
MMSTPRIASPTRVRPSRTECGSETPILRNPAKRPFRLFRRSEARRKSEMVICIYTFYNMSAGEEEELPPSKLGTKDHWDGVYESVLPS